MSLSLTSGAGLQRLLQLSEHLNARQENDHILFWKRFSQEFFSIKSNWRYIIGQTSVNSKSFDIPYEILPRFFYLTYHDALTDTRIDVRGAKEFRIDVNGLPKFVLYSPKAALINFSKDYSQMFLDGSLYIVFNSEMKIELFEFTITGQREYVDKKEIMHMNQQELSSISHNQSDVLGKSPKLTRSIEIASILSVMGPLFDEFIFAHPGYSPQDAIQAYVNARLPEASKTLYSSADTLCHAPSPTTENKPAHTKDNTNNSKQSKSSKGSSKPRKSRKPKEKSTPKAIPQQTI